jgi:hypothetical protein
VEARPADVNKFLAEYFAGQAHIGLATDLDIAARALFAKADKNCDGNLTKVEMKDFLAATPNLKNIFMKDSAGWAGLFDEMDADGDASFDVNEWIKFYTTKMKAHYGENVTDAHTAEAHAADDGAMSKKDKKKAAKEAKKKANAESGNAPAEQQPKQSKKDKKKGGAEVEKTPEELEKMAKKKRAAVFKEGGKKGVEIEGACDMGGMAFFCTQLDEPDGDMELLEYGFEGMNAECDPSEEERKGGAGGVGKVVFSAGSKELLMVCNVPEDRLTETVSSMEGIKPMQGIKATDWLNFIVKSFAKTHEGVQIDASSTDTYAKAALPGLPDLAMFPVKMKDDAMAAAYAFLKQNDCMPPSDDEDEVIYHFEADDGY